MKDFKVGDRIQEYQYINNDWKNPIIHLGTVLEVKYTDKKDIYGIQQVLSEVKVKWDRGEEAYVKSSSISFEDSPLEKEFKQAVKDTMPLIKEKLKLANQYLNEAIKIADENGIPFTTNISALSQSYATPSFFEKWKEVSKEVMERETGVYGGDGFYGWQHSQVCY